MMANYYAYFQTNNNSGIQELKNSFDGSHYIYQQCIRFLPLCFLPYRTGGPPIRLWWLVSAQQLGFGVVQAISMQLNSKW